MKGICLIWSRGRHFSPSLPDRGPTGIWNLAHSISDPRAEISGILVMVRRSSSTSRGTTYWFQYFCCFPVSLVFHLRMRMFPELNCWPREIGSKVNDGKDKLVLRGFRYGDIEHLGNEVEVTSKKKNRVWKVTFFAFHFFLAVHVVISQTRLL